MASYDRLEDLDFQVVRPHAFTVDLVSVQSEAEPLLATLAQAYTGKFTPALTLDLSQIDEIAKTALQTPLEFVNMVFLLRGVTRSFTHQLVRTRIGSTYVQESLRFADLAKPHILATNEIPDTEIDVYTLAAKQAVATYWGMVRRGTPKQAARGILPMNLLTHVYWGVNLRTLQTVMRQRLCCQADTNEWVPILLEMRRQAVQRMGPGIKQFLLSNKERGEACGYGAAFDRPCSWKNGVEDA